MSNLVKADSAPVKRRPGQQPKWTKWVRKLDEILHKEHPVGLAIIHSDKALVNMVNAELPEEDRISIASLERYKTGGHIDDGTIESVFVRAYTKALHIQAENIMKRLAEDVPGGWQKWAWIMERKFDEWNLRSKVVDETPDVARLVMRVKSDERLAEGDE